MSAKEFARLYKGLFALIGLRAADEVAAVRQKSNNDDYTVRNRCLCIAETMFAYI